MSLVSSKTWSRLQSIGVRFSNYRSHSVLLSPIQNLSLSYRSRHPITTYPPSYSTMPPQANGQTNGRPKDRSQLVPFSSRLKEGRALAQDVWSIFKYMIFQLAICQTNDSHSLYSAANLPADCLNLGQGYMNFSPPQWIRDAASEALGTVVANHYSHPKGRPRLRQALKNYYAPLFERDLDIETEILITSGANEGKGGYKTI